ncbi:putative sodium/myo-inositol cotransporter [marine gamma proteobacterium HTCC2143]|uniref:Putative sodium/myo-inositol cotransporter n=1 Tax=marine gamma proteobacterium HTCC2143 TaxID=247633 RepID=A0YHW0_9GAMM|nr:putative sodium/myo-inositol cotransporter [marine gamma proteobacterium HTCC2143]
MGLEFVIYTLASCIFFMAIVAFISYQKTKGEVDTKDGYFLAGRGLTGIFIAGSMVLTNLSAEQLIGLNGSAYGYNMSSMAWEVTAGIATIVMALVFLPKYLSGAFSTLPEFLSDRFDDGVRRLTVVLFLVGYGLITIPSVLYAGSIAVLQLFDVPALLNLSYSSSLVITIVAVGVIGSIYAVFGGLKAVAVSDTINGVGLLIIGITVPIFGFAALGDGSVSAGINQVLSTHTEKLNAIGAPSDPTPFGTIFTGMIFANLFYWGTNQYVIQRTLGAKNLAEGQKGVLYTGYFKLLVPFMMMLPGVIAFHLYGGELQSIDLAFPYLVKNVLPVYMSGFFLAVLLGAVFSSFNSLLHSAATLFVLDIYKPMQKTAVSDEKLIKVAKIASVIIALFSFAAAPLLQYAPEGIFQIIRIFTGFYNIPVIAVVLVGLFTKRVPGIAATIAIVFHIIAYGLLQFVIKVDINFLHIYAILFFIEVSIMLTIGYWKPLEKSWHYQHKDRVDMTPWAYALPTAITLFSGIVMLYVLFSPIGLVGGLSSLFWPVIIAVLISNIALCFISVKYWRSKYSERLHWNET